MGGGDPGVIGEHRQVRMVWIRRYRLSDPQVSSYPSHLCSCPTEIFPVSSTQSAPFHASMHSHMFFLTPRISVPKILLILQVPLWRSPLPGSLPALSAPWFSYCTFCTTVVVFSYQHSLINLVCLQIYQWSF